MCGMLGLKRTIITCYVTRSQSNMHTTAYNSPPAPHHMLATRAQERHERICQVTSLINSVCARTPQQNRTWASSQLRPGKGSTGTTGPCRPVICIMIHGVHRSMNVTTTAICVSLSWCSNMNRDYRQTNPYCSWCSFVRCHNVSTNKM